MPTSTLNAPEARPARMFTTDSEFDERKFDDLLRRTAGFLKRHPSPTEDEERREARESIETEEGGPDS